MKKMLVVVLLAVALVAPVFAADQGAKELDVKAGFTFMAKGDIDMLGDSDINSAFLIGVDFFYYVKPELAIGGGITNIFNAKIQDAPDKPKIGFTNIYAQAKYVIDTQDDVFNNFYPLLQIGYGIINVDCDYVEVDSNGICWGIGIGTTIKENVQLELMYLKNNGTLKASGTSYTSDATYSALAIKLGYKFAL
jgi:opacity protein-like surface antigen